MIVLIEGTNQQWNDNITKDKLRSFLHKIRNEKIEKSADLAKKIEQYEKKRMAEEMMYRSMSSFRKLLTGRRPDHHLAVEYMVFVKRPMQEIDELTVQIRQIDQLLLQLDEEGRDSISVPPSIVNELQQMDSE